MTKKSPFEAIRSVMETKTGKVGASTLIVLGALGLAGCAQEVNTGPDKSPTSTSSESPSGNGGETTKLTYQQEIQKGIEARPKEGVSIVVANYPSLEDAAKAWTNAYVDCLFSGDIQMTQDNKNEYAAFAPGGTVVEKLPTDFKLAENFAICASNLVANSDNGKSLINAGANLNSSIEVQKFFGRNVDIINRNFNVSGQTDSSIKAILSFTLRVNGENPADILVGGTLENIDSNLVYTGSI